MAEMDIEQTIQKLNRVFHHEADFQHELAWQFRQQHPDTRLRLERRVAGTNFSGSTDDAYIDVWVDGDDAPVPIELKYKPHEFEGQWGDEPFELRRHSAQDVSRFDFIDDIARIESVVANSNCEYGLVVLLTNDHLYWKPPTRDDVVDAEFRLHDGRTLEGTLSWADDVGAGTVAQKRDRPIELSGTYELEWQDYEYDIPPGPEQHTDFRYLLVRVT